MMPARFPDEIADLFPEPPIAFKDREGREIEIRVFGNIDVDTDMDANTDTNSDTDTDTDPEREREALAEMYDAFDPADRAQGIPPSQPDAVREWLDTILADDCLNVIAWDGDEAAGHATLVPDDEAFELAIFVLQEYQEAGIGTRLMKGLLGYGQAEGIDKVWLTVERWNRAAVALYKKIGFETSNAESFELEMAIRLNESDEA